jgi:hypothetical protein
MQMSIAELIDMGEGVRMKARGGGESMKKDFNSIFNILREHYDNKIRAGLLNL